MSGLFSSPKAASTPPPEKINTANASGGGTQFGNYDANGNFVVDPNIITQLTTESDFQNKFRTGTEDLQLGLIDQANSVLPSSRSAQDIRDILPSAYGSKKGLPSIYGANDVQQSLGGLANLSDLTNGISTDFSGDSTRTQDSVFNQAKARLEPVFNEQREQLGQQLADQGIPIGSAAYERELNRLDESQGRQYQDAAYTSVREGSAEAERLARLGFDATGLQAGIRNQGLNEGLSIAGLSGQQREQSFQENRSAFADALNKQLALSGLEQQQRAQGFGEIGTLAGLTTPYSPTPITSLSAGSTGAQAGGGGYELLGALAGGVGAAGGAAAFFSDRRLKESIKPLGKRNGHDWYEFAYKGQKQKYRGVMAQDIQKTNPEAIVKDSDGYLMVNYKMLGLEMEQVA